MSGKKFYTISLEVENGKISVFRSTSGFNSMELRGVLHMVKDEINFSIENLKKDTRGEQISEE